jgi:V8-like Glu-specific endopeptidase
MPIRLTAVGGPLEGQSFEFGKGKATITIGRLEDRDIRFPPDFRSVSRAHLAIVSEGDRFILRPDEPVFVDGEEAMRDDELPRRCEIRLGTRNGPGFRVEWNVLSDMPSTQPPWKRRPRTPARAALRAMARVRVMALAALLVAAGVVGYLLLLQPEPIREHLAAARPSVYLVLVRTTGGTEISHGTAWVIGPGLLATNAHITEAVDQVRKAGHKVFVRANFAPYESHEVLSTVTHPNYAPFNYLVRRHAPVAAGGRLIESIIAYDVGLLRVASGAKLAPPLKLASTATLHRLAAGDEVGYVGYPLERMLAGGVNVTAPTPQFHIASITAVTDFFLAEGDVGERHLIQNSLPATGGASGSPVFNRRGEVIGIFNAANLTTIGGTRIPLVLINFAQRIDLMAELLDTKLETIAASREAVWRKRIAALPSFPEWLVEYFQSLTGSQGAKPALEAPLVLASLAAVNEPAAVAEYEVPGPGALLIQAVTQGDIPYPLKLAVRDAGDGKELGRSDDNTDNAGRKLESIHYPWVIFQTAKPVKIAAVITGAVPGIKAGLRVYFVAVKR